MVDFFSANVWQMITFLNLLDTMNPEIPFSFIFGQFLGLGHPRGPGVSLGRILGVLSIEPFWGGVPPEDTIDPSPPPANENPASLSWPLKRLPGARPHRTHTPCRGHVPALRWSSRNAAPQVASTELVIYGTQMAAGTWLSTSFSLPRVTVGAQEIEITNWGGGR